MWHVANYRTNGIGIGIDGGVRVLRQRAIWTNKGNPNRRLARFSHC